MVPGRLVPLLSGLLNGLVVVVSSAAVPLPEGSVWVPGCLGPRPRPTLHSIPLPASSGAQWGPCACGQVSWSRAAGRWAATGSGTGSGPGERVFGAPSTGQALSKALGRERCSFLPLTLAAEWEQSIFTANAGPQEAVGAEQRGAWSSFTPREGLPGGGGASPESWRMSRSCSGDVRGGEPSRGKRE